jgi:hypothetical protein
MFQLVIRHWERYPRLASCPGPSNDACLSRVHGCAIELTLAALGSQWREVECSTSPSIPPRLLIADVDAKCIL